MPLNAISKKISFLTSQTYEEYFSKKNGILSERFSITPVVRSRQ